MTCYIILKQPLRTATAVAILTSNAATPDAGTSKDYYSATTEIK